MSEKSVEGKAREHKEKLVKEFCADKREEFPHYAVESFLAGHAAALEGKVAVERADLAWLIFQAWPSCELLAEADRARRIEALLKEGE